MKTVSLLMVTFCAVTDGMGGYSGGEIASTYAVDEIREYLASLETVGQQDFMRRYHSR